MVCSKVNYFELVEGSLLDPHWRKAIQVHTLQEVIQPSWKFEDSQAHPDQRENPHNALIKKSASLKVTRV